jgi:histidinol-phosphate phosphatase family protein
VKGGAGTPERRAVFLDRDGTINRDVDLLKRPEELELLEGAADAVRRLNHAGYLAVVITNQSVVARGGVTLEGLDRIHARLEQLLGVHEAYLDRIYACPHHPDPGNAGHVAEFAVTCDCRKPATGSIDAACRDMAIGRRESWFVGDTTSDIEAGRRANLRTILVQTGHAGRDGKFPFDPGYVVADLAAAVSWILDGHPAVERQMAPVAAAATNARLIAIGDVAGGAGSAAAQVLKESMAALGHTAHIIPLDSWLKPSAQAPEATDVTARYDVEDMLTTVTQLVGQTQRTSLDLPVYDRTTRAMHQHRRHLLIDPTDLLIFEGAAATLVDGLVELADVSVHMGMPGSEGFSMDGNEPAARAEVRANFVIPPWDAR